MISVIARKIPSKVMCDCQGLAGEKVDSNRSEPEIVEFISERPLDILPDYNEANRGKKVIYHRRSRVHRQGADSGN